MASGIKMSPDAITTYNEMKTSKKTRVLILDLNKDQTEIVAGESVAKPNCADWSLCSAKKEWECFCSKLPAEDCYYAVYDMNYQKPSGERRDRLILISWCPSNASVRKRMIYTSTFNTVKSALTGIHVEVQSCDMDDLDFDEVLLKVDKS